jgi:hypothetical protein
MICHFGDNQVLVAANGVGILYGSLAPLVHGSEPVKVVSIKMFGKCSLPYAAVSESFTFP